MIYQMTDPFPDEKTCLEKNKTIMRRITEKLKAGKRWLKDKMICRQHTPERGDRTYGNKIWPLPTPTSSDDATMNWKLMTKVTEIKEYNQMISTRTNTRTNTSMHEEPIFFTHYSNDPVPQPYYPQQIESARSSVATNSYNGGQPTGVMILPPRPGRASDSNGHFEFKDMVPQEMKEQDDENMKVVKSKSANPSQVKGGKLDTIKEILKDDSTNRSKDLYVDMSFDAWTRGKQQYLVREEQSYTNVERTMK